MSSVFEFYNSEIGSYDRIINGVKESSSYAYQSIPSQKKVKRNATFIPVNSSIKCPYCKKSNHYNLEDFKERRFILDNQSKRYYVCKHCNREVDV